MGNARALAREDGFSRRSYLSSDHRATVPSAPPLARLSAVSDCDSVACGCHATPPTLSLWAVEDNQMGGGSASGCTHLLTSISEYTPAHSITSHFPTNSQSPVSCCWGKTGLGLSDVGHRFVNPSLQSSRNAVRLKFMYRGLYRHTHLDVRKDLFPQVDQFSQRDSAINPLLGDAFLSSETKK